ncbi:MAG: hypothetical protein PVF58_14400 [Candidatus Methanofastidiosia archaeon]|jgi:hypothetical protein
MQSESFIALGQFPVTQVVGVNQLWEMSHFGLKLITQKSSIASRNLESIVNRDRTIRGPHRVIQVPWGCGDSVMVNRVPTSSKNGQMQKKDGKRRSSSIQGFSKQKRRSRIDECQKIVCPVCGKILSKGNLPDAEGIFTDGMCYYETDKIISSQLFIEHEFSHFYNEEDDCVMKDPHELKALIQVVFDSQGACTEFQLVKVWPASE